MFLQSRRGLCYLKVGDAENAFFDAKECIKIDGKCAKGWILKAQACTQLMFVNEAISSYYIVLRLEPKN